MLCVLRNFVIFPHLDVLINWFLSSDAGWFLFGQLHQHNWCWFCKPKFIVKLHTQNTYSQWCSYFMLQKIRTVEQDGKTIKLQIVWFFSSFVLVWGLTLFVPGIFFWNFRINFLNLNTTVNTSVLGFRVVCSLPWIDWTLLAILVKILSYRDQMF